MHPASYYRDRADHARRVASRMHQPDIVEMLRAMVRDYDDIAEDLECGAIEMRHPGVDAARAAVGIVTAGANSYSPPESLIIHIDCRRTTVRSRVNQDRHCLLAVLDGRDRWPPYYRTHETSGLACFRRVPGAGARRSTLQHQPLSQIGLSWPDTSPGC